MSSSIQEKSTEVIDRIKARLAAARQSNDKKRIPKYETQLQMLQYTQYMLSNSAGLSAR